MAQLVGPPFLRAGAKVTSAVRGLYPKCDLKMAGCLTSIYAVNADNREGQKTILNIKQTSFVGRPI